MPYPGHTVFCGCVTCKTYDGQSAANREAERREENRQRERDKASRREADADYYEQRRLDREQNEARWRAEADAEERAAKAEQAAQRARDEDRKHAEEIEAARRRDHEEQMRMLAQVRESNLMLTEEGRAILAAEAEERALAAERAKIETDLQARRQKHTRQVRERVERAQEEARQKKSEDWAARSKFTFHRDAYLKTPHPDAKVSFLPTGKDAAVVAGWVGTAAFLVMFLHGWPGTIVALAAAGFVFAKTSTARTHKDVLAFTPVALVVMALGAFIARGYAYEPAHFIGLAVAVLGAPAAWVACVLTVRKERLDESSRRLRQRDLDAAPDPDMLVASVLSLDVDEVRLPAHLR